MSIFNKLSKLFASDQIDEPIDQQRQETMADPLVRAGLWEISEGCDEIPGAAGEFGKDPANPIPVNCLMGEFAYLNRLRGRTGVGFFFHRIGSQDSPSTEHLVDRYELVSVDGSQWETLFLDMYHTHRSTKAPKGMTLMSWSDTPEPMRIIFKFGGFGTNGLVANFPLGLPAIIEQDPGLNSISKGMGKAFARRVEEMIAKVPMERWRR